MPVAYMPSDFYRSDFSDPYMKNDILRRTRVILSHCRFKGHEIFHNSDHRSLFFETIPTQNWLKKIRDNILFSQ